MLRFFRPVLTAVALALVCASPVEAKPAKGDKRLEMARTVVEMVTTRANYQEMLDQMMTQMMAASAQQGAPAPADFKPKMKLVLNEALPYSEMVEWSAGIYAERFTLKELTKLRDFYRTPLGKKLAAELPQIAGEAGKKMGTILPRRLPALMQKHGLIPAGAR